MTINLPNAYEELEQEYQDYRMGEEPDGCFWCGGSHPSTDCRDIR